MILKNSRAAHPLDIYIKNVLSGKEVVGEYIFLAVKRHSQDLKKKNFPYVFDHKKADIVIDFCEICRHWKGTHAGERIVLEDWQKFLISMIYGWRRKDGTKRFREVYIDMARKNAKTTLCALLALFEITLSGVSGAQVYCGATKEDQAIILVNDAGKIAKKTPELANRLEFYEYKGQIKRVVNKYTASFIAPLGRDSRTQDGFDPSLGIMDEYHAHDTDGVKNVIDSGMGARLDPLMIQITTAGFNKQGPCYKFRRHSIDILREYKKDDTLFVAIFSLDENDDWKVYKNWKKSNPLKTLNFDYLKDRFNKAINEGGTKEVDFRTKNLNQWVDSSDAFIKEDILRKILRKIKLSEFNGLIGYGGLDLAATKDFSAFTLLAEKKGKLICRTWLFIPEERFNELKVDNPEIILWKKNEHIIVTPGNIADHSIIANLIIEGEDCIMNSCNVKHIAFDRWNSIGIINMLDGQGVPMLAYGQGFASMSAPIKELERKIISKEISIDDNPAMVWMYRCIEVKRDPSGNIKFDKEKSIGHIDGPVSQAMAMGAYLSDKIEHESKYKDEDLIIL